MLVQAAQPLPAWNASSTRQRFTLQTYGHVIPGMDKDAAATVADLILTSTQKRQAERGGDFNDAPPF